MEYPTCCVFRADVLPNPHHFQIHLKLLNHRAAIQIVQRQSRSFISFTPTLAKYMYLASLPALGLGGCGTFDSPNSAEDCRVKVAVYE